MSERQQLLDLLKSYAPKPIPKKPIKLKGKKKEILEGLNNLPERCHSKFKAMYSHRDTTLSLEEVIDAMRSGKVKWALSQVQNTKVK